MGGKLNVDHATRFFTGRFRGGMDYEGPHENCTTLCDCALYAFHSFGQLMHLIVGQDSLKMRSRQNPQRAIVRVRVVEVQPNCQDLL